jgi:hypothetical protein
MQIDDSALKIQPVPSVTQATSARQAQKLLDTLSAENSGDSLLHGAALQIDQGADSNLVVKGKVEGAPAATYVKTLLESAYPGVKADTSHITVSVASRPTESQIYIVQPHDTLMKITQRCGHHSDEYEKLFQENRNVLHKKDMLPVYIKLKLPSGWSIR